MSELGSKVWAIPAGHIPPHSTGHEPTFTSRDELHILNTTHEQANLEITIFYSNRDPIGPYAVEVEPRRVRHVRFNDFIDPEDIPMDTDYAAVVTSNVPIVAQHVRVDSRRSEVSMFGALGFMGSD